jgi:hypothetical protein
MSTSKSALLVFALTCVPSSVVADEALTSSAAWPAIEKARDCNDAAAMAFSQLKNESAEEVAKAAFDKCYAKWDDANKLYFNTRPAPPRFTQKQINNNPWLLATQLEAEHADAERNSIQAWRAVEIDRLRVLVMETRLKDAPAR